MFSGAVCAEGTKSSWGDKGRKIVKEQIEEPYRAWTECRTPVRTKGWIKIGDERVETLAKQ